MIATQEFRETTPQAESAEFADIDREQSLLLKTELKKIYTYEGGREIIERCQEEALRKLSLKDKKNTHK